MLAEGTKAPEFALPDQNGEERKLSEFSGRWVLLYFYPKDETPGCTTEACALRDAFDDFEKRDIVILGVSADSPESHRDFALKHELTFTLLSDEQKTAIAAYDAGGLLMTKRISYLIGPDGMIKKTYPEVNPTLHAHEIIADFDALPKE